ncbi:DUF2690 domain-containing protein [Streptomyces sp. NPDC093094]|uniref:DUF2690 domain-containing protein n=1 Tax=Streptomyces sp. NPDC093094 TaxID=3366026 RepID=UPI0038121CBF
MRRFLTKTAAVSAAAVTAALIPLAGTSYAAGSCSGAGCDNLGPVSYGCDLDAVTKKSVSDGFTTAELRWSAKCQAAWVRVKKPESGGYWWDRYGHIEKHNGYAGPLVRSLSVRVPDPGSDWSNMLGGSGYYYRVCISDSGTGGLTCSGYW